MPLRGIQMCGMPPVNATVQILWAFENVWQNGRGHFKLGREVPIDPHDKKWAKWAWRGNIPPRFLCCGLQCGGEVWRSSGRILQTNKTVSNKWHFSKIGYFECNIFFSFAAWDLSWVSFPDWWSDFICTWRMNIFCESI